jgi:RND family efflux transporter MFP subunit
LRKRLREKHKHAAAESEADAILFPAKDRGMDDETKSLKPALQSENKSSPGPVTAPAQSHAKPGEKPELAEPATKNRAASKRKAKKIATWAAAGLAVLLLIAVVPRLFRRHTLAKDKKAQQNTVPSVTVVQAQTVPPTIDVELSGTMSALTDAPVLARADGYLVKRFVDIGDHVHRGQVMAIIDSPDLDQQVNQAQAALRESESSLHQSESARNQAQANQGLAAVSAQRWARLDAKGAVSHQENDTYQANYKAQTANVAASDANVETARHTIASSEASLQRLIALQDYEKIRAPFDGIVIERNPDIGALIAQGSTLVFRIAQIDVLRTYIQVPQTNASSLKVGDPAWISFAEYPGHSFAGAITRTADSLDSGTRTMLTEVQLPNSDHRLLPGMYAAVKLTVPTRGAAVLIPGEALMIRAEGPLVATVTDQNTIHLQQLNIGHDYGNTVEVLGGLSAGQKVVVNPGDTVLEGAKVNPVPGKQSPENPTTTGAGSPGQAAPKSQGQPRDQSQGQNQSQGQGPTPSQSPGQSQKPSQQSSKKK